MMNANVGNEIAKEIEKKNGNDLAGIAHAVGKDQRGDLNRMTKIATDQVKVLTIVPIRKSLIGKIKRRTKRNNKLQFFIIQIIVFYRVCYNYA